MRLIMPAFTTSSIRSSARRRRPGCWPVVLIVLVMMASVVRPAAAQQLDYRLYDPDLGLTNGAITALAQDRAGFLYAGTENGLYRYDGARFSQVGPGEGLPATGMVEAVLAAPDGSIWTVFQSRVYRLRSGAAASVALVPGNDDIFGHRAAMLGTDLLLVRNGHLFRIHPILQSGAPPLLSVRPVLDASAQPASGFDRVFVEQGRIWASCGERICRIDDHGVTVVGDAAGLPGDHWIALLRDRAGTLWLRSPTRIASQAPGARTFTLFDIPDHPASQGQGMPRLDLVEDADGRIVTQGAQGLLVHHAEGWTTQGFGPTFPIRRVDCILRDREGSLWFGTNDGQGLVRLLGFGRFDNWTRAQGLADDMIWNVTRDGGGVIWVAGEQGIDSLPGRDPRTGLATGPTHYPGRALALATSLGGRLWIGRTDGHLIRRDPRTGQSEEVARLTQVFMMTQDPTGPLWVGTANGLFRIDHPDDIARPVVSTIPQIPERVFAITFDKAGEVWVLSEKTLYHRDQGGSWQPVQQIDPAEGYMTRSMAFAADGSLWLGGFTMGVRRLHLDHGIVVGSDRAPASHLSSQGVEMMRADPAGRIWIGNDQGLDVTDGTHWSHLSRGDGLTVDDFDENAAFIDTDGTPWFGTSGGLSHLRSTHDLFRPAALHPMITAVRLDSHEPAPPGSPPCRTHLRWSGEPLVIGFTTLDLRYEKSIRFRYRLRGFDRDWVETTTHEARYTNPPFGRLVFEIVAIDPVHGLSSDVRTLIIKMRPPWWKSVAAEAACIVLAAASLMLLWRFRISYLLARQRQLEAVVALRTSEIEAARLVLLKQATTDELTGLMNRAAVMETLRAAMLLATRAGTDLTVALLDLDHFKRVNDTLGHLAGDAVLAEIGRRLAAETRGTDAVGRYGGEELLIVLPGLQRDAWRRIDTLHRTIFAQPIAFDGDAVPTTGSMGVTSMMPGDDLTALIARADAALYIAKREGRDRVVFRPADAGAARPPATFVPADA